MKSDQEKLKEIVEHPLYKGKSSVNNSEWVLGYIYDEGISVEETALVILESVESGTPTIEIVQTATLCMYTGLEDKNLYRIFENDILRHSSGNAVVVQDAEGFEARYLEDGPGVSSYPLEYFIFGSQEEPNQVEVIGNLFD